MAVTWRNSMRAYQLDGQGEKQLSCVKRTDPDPGPGEVLVRMRAASLNYRDLLVMSGMYGAATPDPVIPLSDGAGEIVEIGSGVTGRRIGERVAGAFYPDWILGPINADRRRRALGGSIDGVLAELVTLPAHAAISIPEHLTYEEASTLPCAALTAWNALTSAARLEPGMTVLLQGSGGVSVMALQFAKLMGARVIHMSGDAAKRKRLTSLGADHVINYRDNPDWQHTVLDLTGGIGVDVVVEVGGPETLRKSLDAVRIGGTIVSVGFVGGGSQVNPRAIISRCVTLRGISVGSCDMFTAMNRAISLHRLRPIVGHVYGFDDAAAAYSLLRSGGHFGKVVVTV